MIDDKGISHEGHTIMSNYNTGKIALLIESTLQSQLTQGSKKTEEDKILLQWIGKINRCRHTIVQSPEKWSERRKEIINEVFTHFSELQIAYQLGQDFKQWYNKETQAKDRFTIQNRLHEWYKKVKEANIEELTSVVKMIQKHQYEIINYFKKGTTNAKAERLNGKIERFISNNYGVRDKDFALYRIANYFS